MVKKNSHLKEYLNAVRKIRARAPIWTWAKSGDRIQRRKQNWRASTVGKDYRNKFRK